MKRLRDSLAWVALIIYNALGQPSDFALGVMRPLSLGLTLVLTPIIWQRRRQGEASDLELAMCAYLLLATGGFWLFPESLGRIWQAYPVTALYAIFFLMAGAPPLMGREPFTTHFARQQSPQAVWETNLFKQINRRLTGFWAALFAVNALLSRPPTCGRLSSPPGGACFAGGFCHWD